MTSCIRARRHLRWYPEATSATGRLAVLSTNRSSSKVVVRLTVQTAFGAAACVIVWLVSPFTSVDKQSVLLQKAISHHALAKLVALAVLAALFDSRNFVAAEISRGKPDFNCPAVMPEWPSSPGNSLALPLAQFIFIYIPFLLVIPLSR